MTFEDVEFARRQYRQKTKRVRLVILLALLILASISLVSRFPADSPLPSTVRVSNSYPIDSLYDVLPFAIFGVMILTFLVAFSYAVAYCVTGKERRAYHRAYKAYFVEQSLRSVFDDLHYEPNRALDPAILKSTGMIDTGDRFRSNDFIAARYQNVLFMGADAQIDHLNTDSDGHTYYTNIFHGQFMIFEFPKKFDFRLELISKGFHAYRIPGKDPTSGRKMSKIRTESSDFNRTFKILGEDGFEAYYLLDPATMVRLEEVANRHSSGTLFGFTGSKLLVALDGTKDSFEPPSAKHPLDEAAETAKVRRDIEVITGLIDRLKLSR